MAISILLLESNDNARAAYAAALRAAGWTVVAVADSDDAHAAAAAQAPDVIVVGFDGAVRENRFHLCKRLATLFRTRRVPILLTSAAIDQSDLELATQLGALALALEPPDAPKLVSAVHGVVAAHRKPSPIRASLKPSNQKSSRSR